MDPDRPDRAWMRMNRADKAYHIEVDKFIEAAKKHAAKTKSVGILCPCKVYKNEQIATEDKTIRSHLIINGFVKDYHTWIYHGEKKITYEFISDDDEDIDEDMPLKARGNYFDAVDNNEGVQMMKTLMKICPSKHVVIILMPSTIMKVSNIIMKLFLSGY